MPSCHSAGGFPVEREGARILPPSVSNSALPLLLTAPLLSVCALLPSFQSPCQFAVFPSLVWGGVKQLLFAERMVGPGGVVGRPRSMRWDRAVADLSRVLTPRLTGWGWYGVAQDRAQRCSLGDSADPAI
eukprot:358192-Chlamydomonas_euryale.AAC.5